MTGGRDGRERQGDRDRRPREERIPRRSGPAPGKIASTSLIGNPNPPRWYRPPPGKRTLTMQLPAAGQHVPQPKAEADRQVARAFRGDAAADRSALLWADIPFLPIDGDVEAPDADQDAQVSPQTQEALATDSGASLPHAAELPVAAQAPPEDRGLSIGSSAPVQDQGPAHAALGLAGASEPLPHRDAIEASFGRHDISAIRAQTGGSAGEAAKAMGATAFATGNTVGFAGPPDLHTAAHEAAHVVQQRGGVQLRGGVGQPGDRYEQHADAVAERVVRGESAESLLDQVAGGPEAAAGGSMAAPAVQAHPDPAVYDHAGKLRQLAERARTGRQPTSGETRPPVDADVDTQSVGEDFARGLGDEELEQTIEYLIQRRDDPDLQPADREVAASNLAVLAAESKRRGQPSGALDRDAVRTLLRDATQGVSELAALLRPIAQNSDSHSLRALPVMNKSPVHAVERLAWVVTAMGASVTYLDLAGGGEQGGAGVIGMAATRAHAAHAGLAILRPWCAMLQLHDYIAVQGALGPETQCQLLATAQGDVEAVFARLAGFDPDEVAAASADVPARIAALGETFDLTVDLVERSQETLEWSLKIMAVVDIATAAASLRGMFTMRGPPSARSFPMPVIAGASGGAATMGRIVVSAEWIAAIKHLIEIGAISAVAAAELLRARGFTHAMAQASDLPPAVVDLLGEGPTTDAMKVTDANRAGAARPPRHHVLPQENRKFFEERGFTGDLDIDNFCVELGLGDHGMLHAGRNAKLAKPWEWNQLVMDRLRDLEEGAGRRLNVAEIMREVQELMRLRKIPIKLRPYKGEG